MRTNDIAKQSGVHPNTVRLYEEWGYISPVPRLQNGYRQYSEIHLKQMLIARLAFRHEFIQNNLRKMATKIVRLSGQQQFEESLNAAQTYLDYLKTEANYAEQAVRTVSEILQNETDSRELLSHKDVAEQLQLTQETIRNWERNGLFSVNRDAQNRRQYTSKDVQKLLVIRTLRSAHFSVASIRHFFEEISDIEEMKDPHLFLKVPKFQTEFYHVTDELEQNLKKAMTDVESIITLLSALQ